MRLLCLLGRHTFDQRHSPDRLSALGNPAPRYLVCRHCGHERDVPVFKESPDPPFIGG